MPRSTPAPAGGGRSVRSAVLAAVATASAAAAVSQPRVARMRQTIPPRRRKRICSAISLGPYCPKTGSVSGAANSPGGQLMQHCRSSSKKITVALGATVAGLATVSAHAQEALEEIVVTALRRAESLQDAPATVTAFDAETVEQARIQSMRDYVNLTSNMTL